MTQLSRSFTLEEFEYSDTALEAGINNKADGDAISCMQFLCSETLQPLRDYLDVPLILSSGYRCYDLNRAVGSDANSQHVKGMAADVCSSVMTTFDISRLLIVSGIPFDQLIYEKRWVHISSKASGNRGQVLTAIFKAGKKTRYTEGLKEA